MESIPFNSMQEPRNHSTGFGVEDLRPVLLSRLSPNQVLRFPIHDQDGLLLLAGGSEITPRVLEAIAQRGIRTVLVHRQETAANFEFVARGTSGKVAPAKQGAKIGIHTKASRRLDGKLTAAVTQAVEFSETAFLGRLPEPGAQPYDDSLCRELCQSHENFVTDLRSTIQSMVSGEKGGDAKARGLVSEYLSLLTKDLDLFACFASSPFGSNYPHRHSLHVAMLSLAIGVRCGLGELALQNLGLGALLHDLGMTRISKRLLGQRSRLSVTQHLEIMEHPIHTLDALEGVSAISEDVRYICYQVHERAGGQGYPRRVPSELIHPLAKIVGIADAYVAMVSDRTYRPAIQPYIAMESILRQVKSNIFDAETARLLLETLSLYPVGSYVRLNDRRLAKVVRSNGRLYHRPVVRVWAPRTKPTDQTGELVDLRMFEDLKVVEALPAPPL